MTSRKQRGAAGAREQLGGSGKADNDMDDRIDATPDALRTHINLETGVMPWADLVRFFARGVVVKVSAELDLVEAAQCLANDNAGQLQEWLASGSVTRASDDDARDWTAREPDFWCVVTAPWVLVQETRGDTDVSPIH